MLEKKATSKMLDPDPAPRPWKTWTHENLDPEKPGLWKMWETAKCRKKIFFSFVSTKAPPAANMPWGFIFRKNDKLQIKKVGYTVYTKVILNET